MEITVNNTNPNDPRVTLFGELQDGSFAAKVMAETAVPYRRYWDNEIEQLIVYIVPDDDQLDAILKALHERRLPFKSLQDYGSVSGGSSKIPV